MVKKIMMFYVNRKKYTVFAHFSITRVHYAFSFYDLHWLAIIVCRVFRFRLRCSAICEGDK